MDPVPVRIPEQMIAQATVSPLPGFWTSFLLVLGAVVPPDI